ncbi:MAG: hypothetical protein PHN52_00315 [candidate division Zixibacteria bacterium]|nr:hypothetical protein [candidate division Zixibacteria bacterium]
MEISLIYITLTITGLLIIYAAIPFHTLLSTRKYEDPKERKEVLNYGDSKLYILGGELEPNFWGDFITSFDSSPVEHLELIFGPRLIIEKQKYDKYIHLYLEKGKLPEPNDCQWLDCHPVLSYFNNNPNKITLYLKNSHNEDERHFSVGNKKNVCIEDPHGQNLPGGGIISRGDDYLYQKKMSEFNRIKKCMDFCTEFERHNAHLLFSMIKFEYKVIGDNLNENI